jgi:hypothetical protein
MALPEIVIGSKLDAKGFKQAESATEKLGKSVKNLAKTLGLAFSAAAVINYGKAAVRASLEAQAQQQRLAQLLKVTNGATKEQVDILNQQAAALEKVGVVSGGNVTQVQSQLATFDLQLSTIQTLTPAILDYVTAEKGATASAGEFKSMTNGLAQALQGNFKALTSVGFILDKNTKNLIANGTEAERAAALVKVLNSTYKDFNRSLRDTPAGQFQVLANSADAAKVIIGTDLLAAMQLVSGPEGIGGAADAMEEFATQIGNVIYGMGVLTKKVKDFVDVKGFNLIALIPVIGGYFGPGGVFEKAAGYGAGEKARLAGTPQQSPGERLAIDRAAAAQLARSKKADQEARAAAAKLAATEKARLDRLRKITAEKKKAEALDKASALLTQAEKIFDSERIQLQAAAMSKQTEEDKVRIRLKSQILDLEDAINAGNINAAAQIASAINQDAKLLGQLRGVMLGLSDIPNPFTDWLATLEKMLAALLAAATIVPTNLGPNFQAFTPAPGGYEGFGSGMSNLGQNNYGGLAGAGRYGGGGAPVVNISVAGSITTDRDLVSMVTNAIYNNQASGIPINYSTAY